MGEVRSTAAPGRSTVPGPAGRPRRSASLWPVATADRDRLGLGGTVVVALLVGASLRVALMTLPIVESGRVLLDAAVLTGILAAFGLRSVPLRWVVLTYALVDAGLMGAFGTFGDGAGPLGARRPLLWVGLTVAALAICPTPSRRTRALQVARTGTRGAVTSLHVPRHAAGTHVRSVAARGSGASAVARVAVGAVLLVLAVTLLAGPWAAGRLTARPSGGDRPNTWDAGPDNALSFQDRLDMTRRPRLTDAVVMTVGSDIESFWRNGTYDRWDGRTWTNTDLDHYRNLGPDGELAASPDDVAAAAGLPSTQQVRIEGRYASALPLAPSATSVTADTRVVQLTDGSLVAPEGLGRGASYTVRSRQVPVTAEMLAAADGPVPAAVHARYGMPAESTPRVRDLAHRIVEDAGATGAYEQVRSIESWMSANLTYSLDAPLAPTGVDVVDDFLFRSRVGWCEQIASSLVVLLREVGVPARLATGFAPGERDAVSRRYVVRERDAHAWAEVWFPDVGWVPFDPTASVPFAGEAAAGSTVPIGFAGLAAVAAFLGFVAVAAAPLARRLHSWRLRRRAVRAERRLVAQRWDVRVERELEEIGRGAGRPRAPAETVTTHARELAAVTGRSELADRGREVDDHRYGKPPG